VDRRSVGAASGQAVGAPGESAGAGCGAAFAPATIPRVKIGLCIPTADDGTGAGAPSWSHIAAQARRAEDGGIDSLWIFDHLIHRPVSGPEEGYHEAATMLAALAAVTERVELGTLVFATSFRAPAVLAKIAATVDAIAGGRVILGIGCGWHEPEYRAFGFPFDHRVGRFDEALQVISLLVRGARVTFEGRWNTVADAVLLPPPVRRIPILIASKGERMLQLTARYADQWNAAWFGHPNDRFHGRVADLRKALNAAGRDPATVNTTWLASAVVGSTPADAEAARDGLLAARCLR